MAMFDSKNIVVAGTGHVRVSPIGTAVPATLGSAVTWDPAWLDVGFTDEKGVEFQDSKTLKDVGVWQSFYPALKFVTDRKSELQFTLAEWTKETTALAFGGGTWTTTTGIAKYTPPTPGFIDIRQIAIDWVSQGKDWRIVFYNGLVDSNLQTTLGKQGEALLPITVAALGNGDAAPWNIWSNAPGVVTV